jgi:uncharacterized protein YggE
MISSRLSACVVAITALCSATGASAQREMALMAPRDAPPQITVTGEATSFEKPDVAFIGVGVQIERPTAREAADEASRIVTAMIADLRKQGVADNDIKTTLSTIAANYDIVRGDRHVVVSRKQRGYLARYFYSIRVNDVAQVGNLARRAIATGANDFSGVTFGLKDKNVKQIALDADALRNARTAAEAQVSALGIKLGRILVVQNGYPRGYGDENGSADLPRRVYEETDPPIPLAPGEIRLSSTMSVTWEVTGLE